MIRLLSLILCLLLLNSVHAEENDKPTEISPWLYKKLNKTELLISNKSYQQAEQNLQAMLTKVDSGSYEQATVLRSLSSVYALSGKYTKATKVLSKCLALNVLPRSQQQQAILNLGQLYMAIEQYANAIRTLEPWLASNSMSDVKINVLIANAYAQLKHYRKALPYIKKAIASSNKPDDSWYQLNLALYYELGDYSSATKVLKKLIRRYPDKKTYWIQLSTAYQQLKNYNKAASIKHLAYKKGFIGTEKDILELANMFLFINSPYKAAKILEQGIEQKKINKTSKNWEVLANAWTMAKEFDKAVKALEFASRLDGKARLYQQLGQIYVEQEKWDKAITAFNKALGKGGLKNRGETLLLQGMSYYELNNYEPARKAFLKAREFGKSRKTATQWLNYIRKAE